jgi:SecD/SecF fusion protein
MMIYYGKAGWYANIALAINLLFLFGILASLGTVLLYPGIAGIVLTMELLSMQILFMKSKRRIRQLKKLEEAVKTSYSWRGAMSSITDANHILTGAVCLYLVQDQLRVLRHY